MLKKLTNTNTSWLEFLYKFPLVLFIIMPGCMGGFFWIGLLLDAALNIHLLKFILPFIGTFIGLMLTALLLMAGHARRTSEVQG